MQTIVRLVVISIMQIWTPKCDNASVARPDVLPADALAKFEQQYKGYTGAGKFDENLARKAYGFDSFPIPPTHLREEYYGTEHLDYWLSGWIDVQKAYRYCPDLPAARKVLDFGCSSGRILRHLLNMCPEAEILGADIKRGGIEWLRANAVSDRALYFHSGSAPYLPFESGSFDKIFAYSVFTHLHQDEEPWLLELKRLLAPGGWLYLTVMTERIWNQIPDNAVLSSLYVNTRQPCKYDFAKPMPNEREVWTFKTQLEIYHEVVFHSTQYLSKNWAPFFTSMQMIPLGHDFQDILIFRK